jgi:hypothetical protein
MKICPIVKKKWMTILMCAEIINMILKEEKF